MSVIRIDMPNGDFFACRATVKNWLGGEASDREAELIMQRLEDYGFSWTRVDFRRLPDMTWLRAVSDVLLGVEETDELFRKCEYV